MNKLYLIIFVTVLALVIATLSFAGYFYFNPKVLQPIACTMEAKLCSDGSYVSRTGPHCEFTQCPVVSEQTTPTPNSTGTIQGKVDVGPICPVERLDSPCPVPAAAYTSREIILYSANGVTEIKRMHFLANGTYSFQVPAGTYVLNIPQQGIGGSRELPKTVMVNSGQILIFNFSIDTGIR